VSDLILNSISDSIYLMPIRSLQIQDVNDDWLIIEHLESESSFSLSPITRNNYLGQEIQLGHRIELNAYVPHNLFTTNGLINRLKVINASSGLVMLKLGYGDDLVATPPKTINYNNKMKFVSFGAKLTYTIENTEFRPRMIINCKHFIKDISNAIF